MQFQVFRIGLVAGALLGNPSLAVASPMVNMTTTRNVGGSEFDAIDFFYASTSGAEFLNYRLSLETTNGAFIFDPNARQRQDVGSDSVDTFMNTVGSLLDLGNANHIYTAYNPSGIGAEASPVGRIDWAVFDLLRGDTNSIGGFADAPYHLARILVSREAMWDATFTAFDSLTLDAWGAPVPTAFTFTNNPRPILPDPVLPPPIDPVLPPIVTPPPVDPIKPPTVTPPPTHPLLPPPVVTPTIPEPVVPPDAIPTPQPPPIPPTNPNPAPPGRGPLVSITTTPNLDGSGMNAVDFFYSSTPGAEFLNYRLNFETTNGALIHDPVPRARQDEASDAVDTFMNTVGSLLGAGDASQIHTTYQPGGLDENSDISEIDWSVFDTLSGDTNSMGGSEDASFHLARVLVSPDALWNASFTAFDSLTLDAWGAPLPTAFDFTNNPQPVLPDPEPAPVIPGPPTVQYPTELPPPYDPQPEFPEIGQPDPQPEPVPPPSDPQPVIDEAVAQDPSVIHPDLPAEVVPIIGSPGEVAYEGWIHWWRPFPGSDPWIGEGVTVGVPIDSDIDGWLVPVYSEEFPLMWTSWACDGASTIQMFSTSTEVNPSVFPDAEVAASWNLLQSTLFNGTSRLRSLQDILAGRANAFGTIGSGGGQQGAPEPSTAALVGLALVCVAGTARRGHS